MLSTHPKPSHGFKSDGTILHNFVKQVTWTLLSRLESRLKLKFKDQITVFNVKFGENFKDKGKTKQTVGFCIFKMHFFVILLRYIALYPCLKHKIRFKTICMCNGDVIYKCGNTETHCHL